MTANMLEDSGVGMSCFSAQYKRWYFCGGIDKDWYEEKGQVIGQLKGDVLTGYLLINSKKIHPWTAKPAPAKEKK